MDGNLLTVTQHEPHLTLHPSLLNRLADPSDPALRLRVLRDLLDYPGDDPDVVAARRDLHDHPWIHATLKAADPVTGAWPSEHDRHYTGTQWSLEFLGDLGAQRDWPEIKRAVQYLLATAKPVNKLRGRRRERFNGCANGVYWGNYPCACMMASNLITLCRFGHASQPITRAGFHAIAQLLDPEEGFACEYIDASPQPACFMAAPKVLKAWLAIPEGERTARDKEMIHKLVALLKRFRLYQYVIAERQAWKELAGGLPAAQQREFKREFIAAGRTKARVEKPGWLRFGFPLGYNPDLLEVVLLLGEAGEKRDELIDSTLQLILDQRDEESGMWSAGRSLNGKLWADLEAGTGPSAWITCRALLAFKRFGLLRLA